MTILMAVTGAVLGFFISFSSAPIAGAVVSGLLSIVTAIGLFYLDAKQGEARDVQLVRMTSSAMLWFYGTLLLSILCFYVASPLFPSNLDVKRDVLQRFLTSSGIGNLKVGDQSFNLQTDAKPAASALLLASDTLTEDAIAITLFGSGTPKSVSPGTANVGDKYCQMLREAKAANPVTSETIKELPDITNDASLKLAARLLVAIDDPSKLAASIDSVLTTYCGENSGATQ